MKKLFDYLIQYGGEIVSSNSLTTEDINQARASERMYVDENAFGFIWMPPVEKFPETEDEVSLFEKWFPLTVELPEHLRDSGVLFDKIEKKKNREITEREIFEALKRKYGEEPGNKLTTFSNCPHYQCEIKEQCNKAGYCLHDVQ